MSQTGTVIQIDKETSNGVIIAADGSEIPFTAGDVLNGGFGELEFRSLVKYSDNPNEFWISAFTVEPPAQAFQRSWGFDEHKKAVGDVDVANLAHNQGYGCGIAELLRTIG